MSGLGDEAEFLIPERRYEKIKEILDRTLRKAEKKWTFTDMLDHVFLNRGFGVPVFLVLLWALFQFTFGFSEPFMVMIEMFFGWLGGLTGGMANAHLASFLSGGICDGLGSVLVFVPPIFALFLALAILEESGYMPRAAFVMDRLMYKVGLHGRSFLPMICGFGCNVPAIMATRSIENERDRLITILVNPLMSCGARLPVYVLIAGVIFPATLAGSAIFSMYILGIALAIIMALLFRRTILRGEATPFLLELPPYRMPTLRATLALTWERGRWFLIRAGTIIFGVVILIWFLSSHPWGCVIEHSYIATFGRWIEPIFRPFGWNWMAAVALVFGFLAKEVVVGTFGSLLGVSETGISGALVETGMFTPLTGFAFMAFTLIYIPCAATVGIVAKETNSVRWPVFMILYLLALAFAVSGLIIGIGHLFGLG